MSQHVVADQKIGANPLIDQLLRPFGLAGSNLLGTPETALWALIVITIWKEAGFFMIFYLAALQQISPTLLEAARLEGASPWQILRRVTLPLVMPGIVSSFLLCFITSFDEYMLAFFLAGSDSTLPIFIFSTLRFPNKIPDVLAMGSLILMVSIVLVVLAEWLRRRGISGSDSSVI